MNPNRTILAIGASSSKNSINKTLATYAANKVVGATVDVLDLNDFEMPIYSIDRELEGGIPAEARRFIESVKAADGIVISYAVHNGSYTAAFKNIIDWVSRAERSIWQNKPAFLLATSPGPRGGIDLLKQAVAGFPYQGGQVAAQFSLPSFQTNFNGALTAPALQAAFQEQLDLFSRALIQTQPALTA